MISRVAFGILLIVVALFKINELGFDWWLGSLWTVGVLTIIFEFLGIKHLNEKR